jgi:hypothetical protein
MFVLFPPTTIPYFAEHPVALHYSHSARTKLDLLGSYFPSQIGKYAGVSDF